MVKIRRGDTVIVIAGRDSQPAKRGVVKQIYDNGTVLVEGSHRADEIVPRVGFGFGLNQPVLRCHREVCLVGCGT